MSIPEDITTNFISQIAGEMNIKVFQITNTMKLLSEGNTVPFIARYRKEQTGKLDEVQIRKIETDHKYTISLYNRKQEVIKSIEEQGKLKDSLKETILSCASLSEIDDIYRPFKRKKKTRGQIAIERGLEPLAEVILKQVSFEEYESIEDYANTFINEEHEISTVEDALLGARDIIAENISHSTAYRDIAKSFFNTASFTSKKSSYYEMEEEDNPNSDFVKKGKVYDQYFEYEENALSVKPHRLLAMVRGDREGVLTFKVVMEDNKITNKIANEVLSQEGIKGSHKQINLAIEDSWKRLMGPSIQRELRRQKLEDAEKHSISIFSENLKNLMLIPPVKSSILGIDPAYRTGCKVAAIDQTGKMLLVDTIYPHPPKNDWARAKSKIKQILRQFNISFVAIGNGTASRETENLVSELAKEIEIQYTIVNEAGASIYSASDLAREEFPDMDVSLRGGVSIARRLQDPLAELVKIDPKSIGVGQYQHDLSGLSIALTDTVEDTVNMVGVDLNTASAALLSYVSGLGQSVARRIVEKRDSGQLFASREDLLNVSGIGKKTFEQAAGFIRIPESVNGYDNSPIHPESYSLADQVLQHIGFTRDAIKDISKRKLLQSKLSQLNSQIIAEKINAEDKKETIEDIVQVLQNPFRDPREDFEKPLFRSEVMSIKDLSEGDEVEGSVTNVVDFGAFIDIGLKNSGLLHISEMSDTQFISHPSQLLKVGDKIKAKIKSIDTERGRIGLTMRDKSKEQASKPRPRKKKMTFEDKQMESLLKGKKLKF